MDSELSDLYSRLIDRLYHEDNLLAGRTSNFITFNAFLAAILALSSFARQDQIKLLGYVIISFGLVLAVIEIFLGTRSVRAIRFWRTYIRLFETKSRMLPFDTALFTFYREGEVVTPVGTITKKKDNQKPMDEILPWGYRWRGRVRKRILSPNTLMGVTISWLVALFWFLIFVSFLLNDNSVVLAAVLVLLILLIFVIWLRQVPAEPVPMKSTESNEVQQAAKSEP